MPLSNYRFIDLTIPELLNSSNHLQNFVDFNNQLRKERQPDDPEQGIETTRAFIASYANDDRYSISLTFVYHDDKLIATLMPAAGHFKSNRHAMSAKMNVLADYRRQGIATALLARVHAFAKEHQRSVIFGSSHSTIPAGAAFAETIGARIGIRNRVNQLVLEDISEALLEQWTTYPSLADFELGFWEKLYDPNDLAGTAQLLQVMNTAPKEDMEIDDWVVTPEDLQRDQASMEARGDKVWTAYARHKESGELAGFSTVILQPRIPSIVGQYGTGVLEKYRGNRLGKALKAGMIKHLQKVYPQGRFIRTQNANSNAQMLAINETLGFRLYHETTEWQLKTAELASYLSVE